MAPVEREYFYEIDILGRLHHDGTELTDEKFLEFFYKRLGPNNSGRHENYAFLSPCGPEMNFVRAAEYPLMFRRLADRRLSFAPGLAVDYEPERLRFTGAGGRLLHPAPVGEYAPLSPDLMLQLGRDLCEWGPYYSLRHEGRETVIEPLHPTENLRVLRPHSENLCFGCGSGHNDGLQLSFLYDAVAHSARTFLTPGSFMQGAPGWMHGGFAALLLDEAMGKVLSGLQIRAPTANLNVDFRRPVLIGKRIEVRAQLIARAGRKARIRAVILNAHGGSVDGSGANRSDRPDRGPGSDILAEATGLFVVPKAAQ